MLDVLAGVILRPRSKNTVAQTEMAMGGNQPRNDCLAVCVDHLRIGGSLDLICRTDIQDSLSFKYKDAVLQGASSGAVQNSSASQYSRTARQIKSGKRSAEEERETVFKI